ncbi:hypothetical protein AB0N73_07055 [Microbacterium sp. NPDC089189]|uniref:hypothetical protein n=1 Tax=Microbacterium sp. NPDC089189 TaxID=3154972 RepID=UPI003428A34A
MIRSARVLLISLVVAGAAVALAGCVPEPAESTAPTPVATTTPNATPLPEATDDPAATDRPQALEITLPADCDALYSSAMRAGLDAAVPPLNDPGITLTSTQVEAALQLIESGVPTLRCTWGVPSELGISTNVTIVDPADAPRIQDLLAVNGFTCADADGGILCASGTESHFLRGNGWVATSWVGTIPDGYTQDVARTLWG